MPDPIWLLIVLSMWNTYHAHRLRRSAKDAKDDEERKRQRVSAETALAKRKPYVLEDLVTVDGAASTTWWACSKCYGVVKRLLDALDEEMPPRFIGCFCPNCGQEKDLCRDEAGNGELKPAAVSRDFFAIIRGLEDEAKEIDERCRAAKRRAHPVATR